VNESQKKFQADARAPANTTHRKKKVVFYRDYREFRGGHLKVYDYFGHLTASTEFTPEIFLTSQSLLNNPWSKCDSIVEHYDPMSADILFLGGFDWKALDPWPKIEEHIPVVNLIQGFGHCQDGDERMQFLTRKALRICVSHQLRDAVMRTGLCSGPVITIENSISFDADSHRSKTAEPESVLTLGVKKKQLALRLQEGLASAGVCVQCIAEPIERQRLLSLMSRSEIVVTLPSDKEGFYLPALEVMKLNRNLICPDCTGNRSFCEDLVTCLMPEPKLQALLGAVELLRADKGLAKSLREAASSRVEPYTAERERTEFINALNSIL
jgi:hypothetical protein